ncbi:MAG TPA: LPS assembly lipoprotein LptE [Aggregicoccus sp.]|nr:LPS assembly lipoprotein LptE [Aggregicoccus sp.]
MLDPRTPAATVRRMVRARAARWQLILAVGTVGLAGCGYRFTPRGGALPEGVRAVCAPLFQNRTAEPGLETLFTQSLREQLVRAGTLANAGCEARIEGEVQWVGSGPTIVTQAVVDEEGRTLKNPQLASYRASASALLRLKKDDRVLSETVVTGAEDFLPGGDVVEAETNRQAALRRLTETLMREGYDRLASSW